MLASIPVSINRQYVYDIDGVDSDGDPITYSLAGDTHGATVDAETGLMTWQPSGPGTYHFVAVASDDLIDLVHTHPFIADGGPDIQFNMVFARARTYRVWVQFQRNGVVNTAHFDIPVKPLE